MLADLGSINQLTSTIIKAAIEVHRHLGPGLLESVYVTCLIYELKLAGLAVECDKTLPLVYKGVPMDVSFKFDLRIEGIVILEVKSVEQLLSVHGAQLMTYLKLARCPVGLLLNFNVPVMKDGVRRILNRAALEQ